MLTFEYLILACFDVRMLIDNFVIYSSIEIQRISVLEIAIELCPNHLIQDDKAIHGLYINS